MEQRAWRPNYQRRTKITQDLSGNYVFSNIRDFTWNSEDENQKQHWVDDVFDPNKIEKAYYLTEAFWPWDLIAHSMISFHFTDGRQLCISVEAPLHIGEEYDFFKALFGFYDIFYIWWTENDHVSLRTDLRNGTVHKYLLNISKKHARELFRSFVEETKTLEKQQQKYGLIHNSCLTALWRIASGQFKLPRWSFSLLFARLTPRFLAKLDLIYMKWKRVIKPQKK